MATHNANIYGPASHNLDRFTIYVERLGDAWCITNVIGGSNTHKGQLWRLENYYEGEGNDAGHLNCAMALYTLGADLARDRPGTQERAQFVASGGLYEQLNMF